MRKPYGFDLEFVTTNGFRPFSPESYLLSAGWCGDGEPEFFYFEGKRDKEPFELRKILQSKRSILCGHSIGSTDVLFWEAQKRKIGYTERTITTPIFCTMTAQTLIDENIAENSLQYLSKKYLGESKIDVNPKEIPNLSLEDLEEYNKQDAWLSRGLYEPMMHQLDRLDLIPLFELLMEALQVLINQSIRGVGVDFKWLNKQGREISEELNILTRKITDFANRDINPNSYPQMQKFLYEELKLPILGKTKTGNPAVDELTLIKLKQHRKINDKYKNFLDVVISRRKLLKFYTTYVVPLATRHIGFDKRCHTTYYIGRGVDTRFSKDPIGARSGRLAAKNPNLQNQPKDSRIRGCFIPSPGRKFFLADYKQLEMRLAGYLSKDPVMQDTFKNDLDIHTQALAGVENKSYEEINALVKSGDPEYIQKRKNIKPNNFGMIYGATAPRLQDTLLKELDLWLELSAVKANMHKWKVLFKHMVKWQKRVHKLIDSKRKVTSCTGRIRRFPKGPADWKDMLDWQRQGFNSIIQGFAVDICLIASVELEASLEECDACILLNTHDSLDGEYDPRIIEDSELRELIEYCMVDHVLNTLEDTFGLEVDDLYLAVDIETNIERWK